MQGLRSSSLRPSLPSDSSLFVVLVVVTLTLGKHPPDSSRSLQLSISLGPGCPALMDAHTRQHQEHVNPGTRPLYVRSHLVTDRSQKQTQAFRQLENCPDLLLTSIATCREGPLVTGCEAQHSGFCPSPHPQPWLI